MNDFELHKELAAHDARNVVLLGKLAERGVDVQAKRSIDLFFYATSESQGTELAAALRARHLEVVGTGPPTEPDTEWSIEAHAHATPQAVSASDYTRSLVQLAAVHGARYDGWGTEL